MKDAIADTTRTIDGLGSAIENAFGMSKLTLLRKQWLAMQDLATQYHELYTAMIEYRDESAKMPDWNDNLNGGYGGYDYRSVKQRLVDAARSVGVEAIFDADQDVDNMQDIQFAAEQADNALKQLYNDRAKLLNDQGGVSGDDAQLDALEKQIKAQETVTALVKEAIEEYESLQEEIREQLELAVENIRDIMRKKLEEVSYKVELRVSLNDRDIKMLDLLITELGEDARKAARRVAALFGQTRENLDSMAEITAGVERVQEIMNNISSGSIHEDWFIGKFGKEAWDKFQQEGKITAEIFDALDGYIDDLIDSLEELYSLND